MAEPSWHLPSTAALRAFDAAARHSSFTRAAAELGQTQGAVSHQIRELEQRLRARLFDRGPRGIRLTEHGEAYLPYAQEALARLRAGALALARTGADTVLTVSMSPNFAAKWLVPRLGAFVDAHPSLDLRISASMEHVTFHGDGIDVAIRHGNGHWPGLHVTRLCSEAVFPVCSPAFLRRLGAIGAPSDLATRPLLHDRSHTQWRNWLEAFDVAVDDEHLTSSPVFSQASLAIDAAVAGQGIALARSALVSLDLAAKRLVRPLSQYLPAPFAYWIVCPESLAGTDKVTRLTRWLTTEAQAEYPARD
jgi:LysR family glycine cleavage system transcriptional activator